VPSHNSIIGNFRDAGERRNDGGYCPWPFEKGTTGAEVPFHNRITRNLCFFKIISNKFIAAIRAPIKFRFSIISAIIFEVNIVAAPKQAQLVRIFVFYKFPLPSTLFLHPLPLSHGSSINFQRERPSRALQHGRFDQ